MRNLTFLGVSSLALMMGSQAVAQNAPPPPATGTTAADPETIVVTATKREETLHDVPVSVSVTNEKTLEQAHIEDLIELQTIVPSLMVSQFNAVGQTNFIIRGFGNGSGNDGIESSVGVFVDGVYRARSAAALDDLPDLERVEVLRGPQSTLFGKNVSAGAINIVTQSPQFTWGGEAEASVGDYGLKQEKASITGPITDTLAFKLSGSGDLRDGTLRNLTTGGNVNNRDRWSIRADLLWTPTDDVSVRVIGDYNEINETCCGVVSILNGPATQLIGAPKPFGLGLPVSDPSKLFAHDIVFNTDPINHIVGKGISVEVDWDASFAKVTSISAYRYEGNQSIQDVDFTGADLANKNQRDDSSDFTQEIRFTSNGDGPFSWQVGGFAQHEHLATGVDTTYGSDIRAFADAVSGGAIGTLETLQHLVTPSIIPGATYFQAGQGISDFYKLDQTSFSIFGQADYKITDRLKVTGGLAYLNDRKEVQSDVVLNDPFSSLNLQNVPQLPFLGLPANIFSPLGALQFFYANTSNHAPVNFPNAKESGVLTGDQVTPSVRVAYDFGPVNAYASFSKGWKAGAYNLSSDSRPPDASGVGRTAAPENVTLYEVGAKANFPGGFFNVALFDQSIDGFQSNDYTGTGYALVNAGEESVRGVELDSAYRPLDWMVLTGALTYLDPKYDSFVNAPCVSYDVVRCPINPATGLTPNFRNLTGEKPAGIPTWSLSTSVTLTHDFGDGLGAYLRGEFNYTSKYQLSDTTPPSLSTYGQKNVDASLGFTAAAQQLEVMLWVRNLTDHNTLIATFPTVAQTGSYSAFPNQPRTFGLTVRKRF